METDPAGLLKAGLTGTRLTAETVPRSATSPNLLRLEEASLNAWPALQQMLLAGWVLRFAGGYSKRANSVNALYGRPATEREIAAQIAQCEAHYARQGLPTIFRITPFVQPGDLDARLEARGYRQLDTTHVQTLDLREGTGTMPAGVELVALSLDAWLAQYAAYSGKPDPTLQRAILDAILPTRYLGCLHHEGRTVACGMAVAEPPYVGLFSLITAPALRRRGYGRALVAALAAWGRQQGAAHAYLQVQESNPPALALYAKLGFREAYSYWYRVGCGG
jgi:N-acetylglutamate synthase